MQLRRIPPSALAALAVLAFATSDARAQEAGTVAGQVGSPSQADFEWSVTHDLEALDARHGWPAGLWSDGETLWISENGPAGDAGVYAYELASGTRAAEAEFELDASNRAPRGLWSDGEVMWVADGDQGRLYAYGPGSGGRAAHRDLALDPRNDDAHGIWSAGGVMWVVDAAAGGPLRLRPGDGRAARGARARRGERRAARHLVRRGGALGLRPRGAAPLRLPPARRRGRGRGGGPHWSALRRRTSRRSSAPPTTARAASGPTAP